MADGSRSSSLVRMTPGWVRFAMPSVADLIFVTLLSALVFTPLSVRLLGDAGIGWHIRAGQQILTSHAIPRVDSFSSTMSGKPWFAWEWMYDVVVGHLDATLGLNGVVWFTAVVIATVFAWMFRSLIRRGTNMCIALGLALLAISASMIHFLARPHVLSWLFTFAWFWILDSSERDCFSGRGGNSSRRAWLLPPLILVWVNLHGGFLFGFALLGIFWLGALWTWFQSKEDRIEDSLRRIAAARRVRDLTWAGLACVVASLVNPYGWRLHAHVYSYLSNRFLMDHIDEFQSPNFHGAAQKCFLVLLLIALAGLAARGRQLRMSEGLTVLLVAYAGLYASRNIPVSSVLLVMLLGPLISNAAGGGGFFQRMATVESGMRGHAWPVLALVGTLVIAINGGRIGSSQAMDAHFDPKRMPVEAVNYLEKSRVSGPVLSPDFWGGYLIYRLYPKMQVVVDDRHDLFGDEFFKSYLKMVHAEPGWDGFLREHPSSYVLVPKQSALASVFMESHAWRVIYSDDVAIALMRRAE